VPVFRLGGLAIAEADHGRHGIVTLKVGVVETLNVSRLHGHAQILLHLFHDAGHIALRVENLGLLVAVALVIDGIALR